MKVVMTDPKGIESLVCESISEYHGLLFVSLMNGNWATKYRKVRYKLVPSEYVMNRVAKGQMRLEID